MNTAVYVRLVLLPVSFDPHALAMALQLANLVASEPCYWPPTGPKDGRNYIDRTTDALVSDWLRAEVQKELAGQP